MIPVGFGKATMYFVGVFIGTGCEESLKHYYKVAMLMSIVVGFLQIIILWALEEQVIKMYTD